MPSGPSPDAGRRTPDAVPSPDAGRRTPDAVPSPDAGRLTPDAVPSSPSGQMEVQPRRTITIWADEMDSNGGRGVIEARGHVRSTLQTLFLNADELFYDDTHQVGTVQGHVRLRGRQVDLAAERATFDLVKELVEVYEVSGILYHKFHVAGRKLTTTPQLIAMDKARFTNCLEDPDSLYLQVERLHFFPQLTEDDFSLHKISVWFEGARLFALPAISFDSNIRTGLPPRLRGVAGLQPLFLPRLGLDQQRGIVLGSQLNLLSLPHSNVLGTVEFGTRGNVLVQLLYGHTFARNATLDLLLGYQSPDALGRIGGFGGGSFSYLLRDGSQLSIYALAREEVTARNIASPLRQVVSRIPEGTLELAAHNLGGFMLRPAARAGLFLQEENRVLALRVQTMAELTSPALQMGQGVTGQLIVAAGESIYKRFRPAPEGPPQHHGNVNELFQFTHQLSPAFSYSPHLRARQVWGETPFTFDREVAEAAVGLGLNLTLTDWWQVGTITEWDFLRRDLINQEYWLTLTPWCYQITIGWQQIGNQLDLRLRLLNL